MNGRIVFRVIAALVLIAAAAGLAYFAFNAGVAQGLVTKLPEGQSGQAPYPYFGYGVRFWHPFPFFGFGCFGPLLALFLLFVALRAFGFLFWGPRGGYWRHGPWHRGWWAESDVPPMFQEWHRRAHGEPEKKDQ